MHGEHMIDIKETLNEIEQAERDLKHSEQKLKKIDKILNAYFKLRRQNYERQRTDRKGI
jgi:uncharacterized protein YabN with tetrapyrrole methylase and pyrophosphatase domain